jgi:predicted PurR-regulated permease PerM
MRRLSAIRPAGKRRLGPRWIVAARPRRISALSKSQLPADDNVFVARALKVTIRVGVVLLLVVWCFSIVRPFLVPVVWGIVIAVASYRLYALLETAVGGRRGLAGAAYAVIALLLLLVPVMLLGGTLLDGVRGLAVGLAEGTLEIPPPPAQVAGWPLIGEPLHNFWQLASSNLEQALVAIDNEVAAVGRWLLGFVGAMVLGLLQFVVAIFIATALVMNAGGGERVAGEVAISFAGADGQGYAELATKTIRSVAKGIIGVALIQSTLAGLGFLVAGVPAAGLLALICLILAIVQIGPALVLIGAVIYQFTVLDTPWAVLFLVWCVLVGVSDNILKPMLLMGAIGGVLSSGILGLFVGPVVLALGYTLFMLWVAEAKAQVARAEATRLA